MAKLGRREDSFFIKMTDRVLEDLRLVVVLPPIEDLNTAVLDDVLSILA